MSYLANHVNARQTPQSEPIPGYEQVMVKNEAGGYVFPVDDWTRLDRFLILGSEGGTYYATERALTQENAQCVARCLKADAKRTIQRIAEISESGRAPKNDVALFALAMAFSERFNPKAGDRQIAAAYLDKVARIGTHLFQFVEYVEKFRGWGRTLRDAVQGWYLDKDPDKLAYQVVKYRQRGGWSHRDLLRLSKPVPSSASVLRRSQIREWPQARLASINAILHWVTKGEVIEHCPELIVAFNEMQAATTVDHALVLMIDKYPDLPWSWEMVPTPLLKEARVWETLLPKMGLWALCRNLGRLTANGTLLPYGDMTAQVAQRLADGEAIVRSRLHPIKVLAALLTYQQGHGERGKLTWSPLPEITDALDKAYYLAFGNVTPTNKRICIGIDISGSMDGGTIAGVPGLSPRVGAAAMAMVMVHSEPRPPITMAFATQFVDFPISKRERLDDVVHRMQMLPMGGTDCSLPMTWALQNKHGVDAFVVITDNETWAGNIHPMQALQTYREIMGIPAKLVVVGMTATGTSIGYGGGWWGPPARASAEDFANDGGVLDVVGFDTATPQLISDFIGDGAGPSMSAVDSVDE